MSQKILTLLFGCLLISSCSIFDSSEEPAMFVSLEEASLVTNSSEGANTHNITDAWVFADGQLIGVFELPITIPVLNPDGGEVQLDILAGVRLNGIKSNPVQYPFYKRIIYNFEFEEGAEKTFPLEFSYEEDVIFEFIEDFESSHIFSEEIDEDLETSIEVEEVNVRSGSASGLIHLTPDNNELITTNANKFPGQSFGGGFVLLEIDYFMPVGQDIDLQVGALKIKGLEVCPDIKLLIRASEGEWKKIYVNLTDELASDQIDFFSIILAAINTTGEDAQIIIDNIKLLHF